MPVRLLRCLVLAPALACAVVPPAAAPRPETPATANAGLGATVILVRHGEKATDDPRDPSLSPAGEARARALAAQLAAAGVTHCFASEFRRTQATLGPLVAASGCLLTVIPAADSGALVAALRGLPAPAVAVVAGHSNTLPAVVRGLGGTVRGTVDSPSGPLLPDDAYDRLFVVQLVGADQPAPTLEIRYGQDLGSSPPRLE